jgi:hypothetical protein
MMGRQALGKPGTVGLHQSRSGYGRARRSRRSVGTEPQSNPMALVRLAAERRTSAAERQLAIARLATADQIRRSMRSSHLVRLPEETIRAIRDCRSLLLAGPEQNPDAWRCGDQ